MGGDHRPGPEVAAVLLAAAALTLTAAPAAASHGAIQHSTGSLYVGLFGLGIGNVDAHGIGVGPLVVEGTSTNDVHGHDGVSFVPVSLDTSTDDGDGTVADGPFWLNSTGGKPGALGPPNFDVCFEDADGFRLGCSTAPGDENGTVPSAAATAEVFLADGREAGFELVVE